jgi:hypothetical protein
MKSNKFFRKSVVESKICLFYFQTDNLEDATIGAFLLCDLAQQLQASEDLDDEIDEIVQDFEAKCDRPVLHTVCFY